MPALDVTKRNLSFNSLGKDQSFPLRVWTQTSVPNQQNTQQDDAKKCCEEEEFDEVGRYQDFHTIDWLREICRNKLRHRQIYLRKFDSCFNRIRAFHDAISAWLLVLLIGLAAGTCAGLIDTTAKWLGDLKVGKCSTFFYMDKYACCWNVQLDRRKCPEWQTWAEIFVNLTEGQTYAFNYFAYVVGAIILSTLAAILVKGYAPYACGSGIPEVKTILGGFIIRGYLGKWTLLIKTVTAPMAVASNLSLGKEGPLVHISACCGNVFSALFPKYYSNEAKKREMLSAAAAAGVSVAFGVPVGGVLFSLEECSYYFPMKTLWRSVFCACVSAFILAHLNPFGPRHTVLFYVHYTQPWHLFELIPFAFLGMMGGLYSAAFIHANLAWCKFRKNSRLGDYPILEVMVVTLITAVAGYQNPYTRIGATPMIYELVKECHPWETNNLCDYMKTNANVTNPHDAPIGNGLQTAVWQLFVAWVFKMVITTFTFGLKIPTGLFIPSLGVGALMGRLVGIGMEQLIWRFPDCPLWSHDCHEGHSCVIPGLYAMVAACASLAGVTRMTVAAVVVMFEMTGGLRYIVPLMLCVMCSKWAGDIFGHEGIYDGHIGLNGYPFLESKDEYFHTALVDDVMHPRDNDPPMSLVREEMTIGELDELVKTTSYNGFPVVSSRDNKHLIGYLYRKDLILALKNAWAYSPNIDEDSVVFFTLHAPGVAEYTLNDRNPIRLFNVVDLSPVTVRVNTPMEVVVEMFTKLGIRQALVTHNGKIAGIVTKKDVLRHIAVLHGEDPDAILFD
uniref:Chloride channel protein n=1 Tax=Ascidia sydneiensis samea TaxID=79730 RepID=Q869D8_ASCSS|nr:CLC chloride channel [Ascidia sydneiensis samea]